MIKVHNKKNRIQHKINNVQHNRINVYNAIN
jgi:hypothetical protein